jgi:dihydrofolate reductase
MRKLIVNTFMSLDGVMQAPGGPEEDPTGGFEHGGWSVNYWDEDGVMEAAMEAAMPPGGFDLLLGRKTYEIFAAHWPHVDEPGAKELNEATKYVASRTLDSVEWENSHLLEGDLAPAVEKLKEGDGPNIHVQGSSDLIQSLLERDLIDEFGLLIFPVVLGKGKRLFGEGAIPAGLELAQSSVASTGVIAAVYRRAGDIEIGSFALEEPTEAEAERRKAIDTGFTS